MSEKKIVFIIGLPYSGSTLLALALGNSDNVINLGEVTYIEKDYNVNKKCFCGNALKDCLFWKSVVKRLEENESGIYYNFTGEYKINKVYRYLSKVQRCDLYCFNKSKVDQYRRKYGLLYSVAFDVSNASAIIDSSKSNLLVKAFLGTTDFDINVIWLKRDFQSVYFSKIKKLKKRGQYYGIITKFTVIIWMYLYNHECRHVYRLIDDRKKITIYYKDIINNIVSVQKDCSLILGENINFGIIDEKRISVNRQHFFTGNRWPFRGNKKIIDIKDNAYHEKFGFILEKIFKLFF